MKQSGQIQKRNQQERCRNLQERQRPNHQDNKFREDGQQYENDKHRGYDDTKDIINNKWNGMYWS